MKTVTIYLLVIVSGSCLLSGTEAGAFKSAEYQEVSPHSFIGDVQKILSKVLSTVRGVECIMKEVLEVLTATTEYLAEIEACGTAVPKEIAKIVKNCQKIISICEDILHLDSTLCANDDDSKVTAPACFWELLKATTELAYKIDSTLSLIAKLPGDTESCFVDATDKVENSYNSFLPNIELCIDEM